MKTKVIEMDLTIKRQLIKLSNKQIAEDIKRYIKSGYDFYGARVPESKILAKRLHEEYSLQEFYRVFNKLWKSGYRDKMSLAVYALRLYDEEFDLDTWDFLKPKLREIKSWDKVDSVGSEIIGKILLKFPELEIEIRKMVSSKNKWFIRMGMMSMIPLVRKGNTELAMKFAETNIYSKDEHVQKAAGIILNEISKVNIELAKKYVLKNIHMPFVAFNYATANMKELRALRKIKKLNHRIGFSKLNSNRLERLMFWKETR